MVEECGSMTPPTAAPLNENPPLPVTEQPDLIPTAEEAPASHPLRPRKSRRGQGRLLALGVSGVGLLVVAVLLVGWLLGAWRLWGSTNRADIILHPVKYERLHQTIPERGQLEAAKNSDIVCRVKARSANSTVATTIRWIVDDGTQVKRGDRLVQLDDSGLYEQLKTQKIALDQAQSASIQADTNYAIVESQNKSDLETAKLAFDLATLDLQKYLKGEYIQTLQEIEGRLLIAMSDLAM